MLGRHSIILLVLTTMLVCASPLSAAGDACAKSTADVGAVENPTADFLRLVRTLVAANELGSVGIADLLADARLGNPIDAATCGPVRKQVFGKSLAMKLSDPRFDVESARSGLREIAGISKESEASRTEAKEETRKIVAVLDTGSMPGKKFDDHWGDAFAMRKIFFDGGVPYITVGKGPFETHLGAVNLRDGSVREIYLGKTVASTRVFKGSKGETFVTAWNQNGYRLAKLQKKNFKDLTDRSLPEAFAAGSGFSEAVLFHGSKDKQDYFAALTRTDTGSRGSDRITLRWARLADGKSAKVHAVDVATETDVARGIATASFGNRTWLAVNHHGDGKTRIVDADSGKVHWDAPSSDPFDEAPHFFESGGEPRLAVLTRHGMHLFNPVKKVDLGVIPLSYGGTYDTPIFIQRGGKNLALIPREGSIAVVDLDARAERLPIPTDTPAGNRVAYAELGDRAYLTWLDYKTQEIVLADFDQRSVFSRFKDYIPKDTALIVFRDGDNLRAMTHIPKIRPHTYNLVSGPKS